MIVYVILHDQADVHPLCLSACCRGGKVCFQDVTFGYNPAHPILKNVSFTVEGGKTLALVGPTGSGKSTVSE